MSSNFILTKNSHVDRLLFLLINTIIKYTYIMYNKILIIMLKWMKLNWLLAMNSLLLTRFFFNKMQLKIPDLSCQHLLELIKQISRYNFFPCNITDTLTILSTLFLFVFPLYFGIWIFYFCTFWKNISSVVDTREV